MIEFRIAIEIEIEEVIFTISCQNRYIDLDKCMLVNPRRISLKSKTPTKSTFIVEHSLVDIDHSKSYHIEKLKIKGDCDPLE